MIRFWQRLRGGDAGLPHEVLAWVDEVWPAGALRLLDRATLQWVLSQEDHPWRAALEESLRRLVERHGPDALGALAAEPYFAPHSWQEPLVKRVDAFEVVAMVLGACLVRYPPDDIHQRLEARLREIFADPYAPLASKIEVDRGDWTFRVQPPPDVEDYVALLTLLPPTPETLDLTERLVSGAFDRPLTGPPPHGVGEGAARAYLVHVGVLRQQIPRLLERLFDHDRLTYEIFAQAGRCMPYAVGNLSNRLYYARQSPQHAEITPFLRTVDDFSQCLAWELAQTLGDDDVLLLKQIQGLRGNHFLVQAARHHDARRLGRLAWRNYELADGIESAVVHLAAAAVAPETAAEHAALAAELRPLRKQTLKALLPIAIHARAALAEALGWQHALPLIDQIVATTGLDPASMRPAEDVANSADPTNGVLDVPAVRAALAQAGEATAREVLGLFRSAQVGVGNTLRLIEVLSGRERAWLEKGLAKRNQTAIKAYGLLPIERGAEEVAERYLELHRYAREARQFGPQRQANEQAAARAALANLAQNAGYRDAARLEWAMEARLGSDGPAPGTFWTIDDYEVTLALDGFRPEVRVQRGGRLLKRVPTTVRKSAVYAELAEALARLREQATRLRAALEQMMTEAEPLSAEDAAGLLALPLGRAMLTALVFTGDDGVLGLLAEDGAALVSLDGQRVAYGASLRVAHPYDLFQAGLLGEWQREIVQRRVVQPIAQVFRELYVLTPVEREAGDVSRRFAGHRLDAAVVSRLFQARGWETEAGDVAVPQKRFPAAGLTARFEFPDAGHFLAELPVVTSGEISFWPSHGAARDAIPLEAVPPPLFSEVMRDADLVVSVAQRDGAVRLSPEGFLRRGELLETLIAELGLPNVTVDGHFARIEGKRADYRVHLGSGAIHIEPGNHLCIVPAGWGDPAPGLFLPFADEGDFQVSVIVSKILLLANDDQITDQQILAQIARVRRG